MVIIFRGKAATGKSLIANIISDNLNIEIVSKDSVFDLLLEEGYSWNDANDTAYDKLVSIIQKNHDNGDDVIVDIGMAHTEYFEQFMSKMTLCVKKTKKFLFICSDDKEWEERINKRILNSDVPNQAFKSIEEAKKHYEKYNIIPQNNEVIIDSALSIDNIHSRILKEINDCN